MSESNCIAARPCGMEAVSESQHRTQVNPCAGWPGWVSVLCITTPDIRSCPNSNGGESGETYFILTPRDLQRSTVSPPQACGSLCEGNDNWAKSLEKSDHLILAWKLGNAGGAKGVTS